MIKGVIFDLAGAILSTDDFHYKAWKKLADRLNIPFNREKNNRLRGVSRMASLEIILEGYHFSKEEKLAFAEEKNNTYRELLNGLTPDFVSVDVRDTLDELKNKGLKIAIGSSSKNTKLILSRVGLINAFDAIADGTDIKKSKPDPEVFLIAAKRIGLEPKDCIVVEDAFAGIDAAVAGGFVPVAIGDACAHKQVKYKLEVLSDLLKIVGE